MPEVRRAESGLGESRPGSRGIHMQGMRRGTKDVLMRAQDWAERRETHPITPHRLRMRFAVEMRHLRRVIACAGDEIGRYHRIDAREIGGVETQVERTERFL